METVGNIVVGKRQVKPTLPSHTLGVREGNQWTTRRREPGIVPVSRLMSEATPRRSTGISAASRRPIDPRMPVLTPA
jgi:hypothetical protein